MRITSASAAADITDDAWKFGRRRQTSSLFLSLQNVKESVYYFLVTIKHRTDRISHSASKESLFRE